VRDYVPLDDGMEPVDFDEYYDYPAQTARDVACRFYVKIERDPERAARLTERQNAAIMEALRWTSDNRVQLEALRAARSQSPCPSGADPGSRARP
jgi:hypothetical protein